MPATRALRITGYIRTNHRPAPVAPGLAYNGPVTDDDLLIEHCNLHLHLEGAKLPDDYFYASLSLCMIDAVWSIGVNYGGVLNVVERYCKRTGTPPSRRPGATPGRQDTMSDLVGRLDALNDQLDEGGEAGSLAASDRLFDNRKPTSRRSGILKAEAVRLFAKALSEHGLQRLEDAQEAVAKAKSEPTVNASLEKVIRAIPGQGSGISLAYFWMLAGDEGRIKPDTMVLRLLCLALGREIKPVEAQPLLASVSSILQASHPQMTPRLLDHLIWKHQRKTLASSTMPPALL